MKRRRCLILADGFYEWKTEGTRKRPYVARPKDGGPIAFAGLWEAWMGPNGEELESVAIVTASANRTLRVLHDRMPVVVPPEAFGMWLDCLHVDAETAAALLAPAPEDFFEAYEISPAVNRVANDDAKLLEPVTTATAAVGPAPKPAKNLKTDDRQSSLF
jgi:putative SOS response-associated peptidase YedK